MRPRRASEAFGDRGADGEGDAERRDEHGGERHPGEERVPVADGLGAADAAAEAARAAGAVVAVAHGRSRPFTLVLRGYLASKVLHSCTTSLWLPARELLLSRPVDGN